MEVLKSSFSGHVGPDRSTSRPFRPSRGRRSFTVQGVPEVQLPGMQGGLGGARAPGKFHAFHQAGCTTMFDDPFGDARITDRQRGRGNADCGSCTESEFPTQNAESCATYPFAVLGALLLMDIHLVSLKDICDGQRAILDTTTLSPKPFTTHEISTMMGNFSGGAC